MNERRKNKRKFDNMVDYVRVYWPLIVALFFAVSGWTTVKNTLTMLEYRMESAATKVEDTEHRVTVLEEQNKQIFEGIKRIERKIDKVN